MKPLVVELFCGRFGWSRGFVAEGYRAVGFDIVHEPYHGDVPEGCSLALQDVLTLHGSQFKDAACIVASPPCQAFSYMAMPWKLAKAKAATIRADESGAMRAQLTALFDACFRIQREACEAANVKQYAGKCQAGWVCLRPPEIMGHFGKPVCLPCYQYGVELYGLPKDQAIRAGYRYIPMVVENVKGAQPWVGPAKAHFGSFYLWGDVESVGGRITVGRFGQSLRPVKSQKFNPDGTAHGQGSWFAVADSKNRGARGGAKVPGLNWSGSDQPGYVAKAFNGTAEQRMRDGYEDGRKVPGFNFHEFEKTGLPGRSFQSAAVDGVKGNGGTWFGDYAAQKEELLAGTKCGGDWFNDKQPSLSRLYSSKSPARKAASALIAEIPYDLALHIAQAYKPQENR